MIVSALESGGQGRNRTADASLFRAALDRSFWHLGCIRFILFEASYVDHLRGFRADGNSQSSIGGVWSLKTLHIGGLLQICRILGYRAKSDHREYTGRQGLVDTCTHKIGHRE
jgi:hypothetical protein